MVSNVPRLVHGICSLDRRMRPDAADSEGAEAVGDAVCGPGRRVVKGRRREAAVRLDRGVRVRPAWPPPAVGRRGGPRLGPGRFRRAAARGPSALGQGEVRVRPGAGRGGALGGGGRRRVLAAVPAGLRRDGPPPLALSPAGRGAGCRAGPRGRSGAGRGRR